MLRDTVCGRPIDESIRCLGYRNGLFEPLPAFGVLLPTVTLKLGVVAQYCSAELPKQLCFKIFIFPQFKDATHELVPRAAT